MIKLVGFATVAIFTAEALVMLLLESWGRHFSLPVKVLIEASLLIICLLPVLYCVVYKGMVEQARLRCEAEKSQLTWTQSLELLIEERTDRLQRANEDLLVEVQERAKAGMALRKALSEVSNGREQLQSIINAVCDALVVIDEQWKVLVANPAAETMFSRNLYDLQRKSLKEFLLPWSRGPVALESFFSRERSESTFLIPPGAQGDNKAAVQMRFGADLEWNGNRATVLMFYFRDDLTLEDVKVQGRT